MWTPILDFSQFRLVFCLVSLCANRWKHALDMDVSNPDDKCKDGGQVATFDGAGGVGNGNADEKETGDVVEDEDEAGEPTEAVAEGTMPGGEDTEEMSAPVGADGVADAAANEAGESTKEVEVKQPPDYVDEEVPVGGPIQNSIVNEYTVLEQVGHDSSSFV